MASLIRKTSATWSIYFFNIKISNLFFGNFYTCILMIFTSNSCIHYPHPLFTSPRFVLLITPWVQVLPTIYAWERALHQGKVNFLAATTLKDMTHQPAVALQCSREPCISLPPSCWVWIGFISCRSHSFMSGRQFTASLPDLDFLWSPSLSAFGGRKVGLYGNIKF